MHGHNDHGEFAPLRLVNGASEGGLQIAQLLGRVRDDAMCGAVIGTPRQHGEAHAHHAIGTANSVDAANLAVENVLVIVVHDLHDLVTDAEREQGLRWRIESGSIERRRRRGRVVTSLQHRVEATAPQGPLAHGRQDLDVVERVHIVAGAQVINDTHCQRVKWRTASSCGSECSHRRSPSLWRAWAR